VLLTLNLYVLLSSVGYLPSRADMRACGLLLETSRSFESGYSLNTEVRTLAGGSSRASCFTQPFDLSSTVLLAPSHIYNKL